MHPSLQALWSYLDNDNNNLICLGTCWQLTSRARLPRYLIIGTHVLTLGFFPDTTQSHTLDSCWSTANIIRWFPTALLPFISWLLPFVLQDAIKEQVIPLPIVPETLPSSAFELETALLVALVSTFVVLDRGKIYAVHVCAAKCPVKCPLHRLRAIPTVLIRRDQRNSEFASAAMRRRAVSAVCDTHEADALLFGLRGFWALPIAFWVLKVFRVRRFA